MAKKSLFIKQSLRLKITWLFCLYLCSILSAHAKTPNILTTIKPIHSLVSHLTSGISQPDLLISSTQSPHDFQMKPSDRHKIARADMIIYVSDSLESYIPEISNTFTDQQTIIELARTPGLIHLSARSTDHAHHHHDETDGHIWLSTENASAITLYLATRLSQYDPANQNTYMKNRDRLLKRLTQLKARISDRLAAIRTKPYLTFHDAFQYFETEFQIKGGHFVSRNPEHISGIKSIQRLKKLIHTNNISCIYYEPPSPPKIIQTLSENTDAQILPLDPVATHIRPGEELYFELINTIANQLYSCLK